MVICTGTSDTHLEALSAEVSKKLKEQGELPIKQNVPAKASKNPERGRWILLDYVNVIVHIFQAESREFYRLEELWGAVLAENHEMLSMCREMGFEVRRDEEDNYSKKPGRCLCRSCRVNR